MSAPAGHVFVIRGDLLALRCDAIGLSGNTRNEPSGAWSRQGVTATFAEAPPSEVEGPRVLRRLATEPGEPARYVVPVAGNPTRAWDWYRAALRVFVERASADARASGAGASRPVPLLAVPLLGAGKGGQGEVAGAQLRALLDELAALAEAHRVDLALVLRDRPQYDAAQSYRRSAPARWWPGLADEHRAAADAVAAKALDGELALFLGAGVSVGAGLPGWERLVAEVAADVVTADERDDFARLPMLDRAELLERRCDRADGPSLGARIAARIAAYRHHGLGHALLALLPVREVVTTNYDTLFERAHAGARGAGGPLHRIPYGGPPPPGAPWVMKLHGCVETPEDIVLSRRTFIQYDTGRAALAGMLASLLVTRHVLVVGSSFTDDNVLRIFDEVQRLWRGYQARRGADLPARDDARFGTNLSVGGNNQHREIWAQDFQWVELGAGAEGGRRLEVFLDRVVAATGTSASYLFEPAYQSLLTDDDRAVVAALEAMRAALPAERSAALRAMLREVHDRFGLRT